MWRGCEKYFRFWVTKCLLLKSSLWAISFISCPAQFKIMSIHFLWMYNLNWGWNITITRCLCWSPTPARSSLPGRPSGIGTSTRDQPTHWHCVTLMFILLLGETWVPRLLHIVTCIVPNQKNQPNLDLYLVRRYKICHFPIVVSYLCIGQNQKNQLNLVLYLVWRSKIFVSVATLEVIISDIYYCQKFILPLLSATLTATLKSDRWACPASSRRMLSGFTSLGLRWGGV